jgi:hypothetical protein
MPPSLPPEHGVSQGLAAQEERTVEGRRLSPHIWLIEMGLRFLEGFCWGEDS